MASSITVVRGVRISNEAAEYFQGKPLNRIIEKLVPLLRNGEMEYDGKAVKIDENDLNDLIETITGEDKDVVMEIRINEETFRDILSSGENISQTIRDRLKNGRPKKDAGLFIDVYHRRSDDVEEKRAEFDRIKTRLPIVKICKRCGKKGDVVYHHIRPLKYGGTNEMSNITTLCEDCHREVHEYGVEHERRVRRMLDEIKGVEEENIALKQKIAALKSVLAE